jgi:YD repeat-containing protein
VLREILRQQSGAWRADSLSRTYDGVGDVAAITDPIGNVQTFTYDSARRPTSVSNSAGGTVTCVRDALGDATSVAVTKPTILPP